MAGAGRTGEATRHGRACVVGRALVVALATSALACGYRPVNEGTPERLHLALVRAAAADATTNDEVLSGAREELAREGALAAGTGYPRVEIEVLREDEAGEGIAAVTPRGGEKAVPRARGSEVGVVARAWIVRVQGGPHEAETGDMRAMSLVASTDPATVPGGGLSAEALGHDDALHATARRLGGRLAQRILGHPVAREELVGE